jgi:hypothetical protein
MGPTRVIAASALALLASLAARTQADPDLWGHVRFGIDILETGDLPSVDPYSFTQDRPWINHEWLSELTMGAAWRWGGTAGLTLLKSVLVIAALLVVWRAYRDADIGWQLAAAAAAIVVGAPLAATVRPQAWSLLAVVVLARELQSNRRVGRRALTCFGLFCLWANAHGGWIVGLAILGVWAVVESLRDRSTALAWTIAIAAAVAGSLATPYGWRLHAFMFETIRLTRPHIEDWLPLWELGPSQWIVFASIVAWSVWLWRCLRSSRIATAAVLICLAAASINVARVLPLFGVVSVVLLAPALSARWPRRALTPIGGRQEWIAAAAIAAVCAAAAIAIGRSSLRCIVIDDERMPDPMFAAALATAPPGRMVTFFNWGEYALWHVGPAIRVSMDGRRETVYSERRLIEHDAIVFGRPEAAALLAAWQPEYAWLPSSSSLARQWLIDHGYRIDVATAAAFLAVRGDLPVLAGAVQPQTGCFPG